MDNSNITPVPQQNRKASWRLAISGNVLVLGLVSLFTDFASEMMNPLLPVFIAGLVPVGAAAVYLGLMAGIAETTASLLKIFSGRISDALGKRKILVILGYGLSAISRPMTAAAFAGWQIIVLKFADRIGKGLRTSPRDALIGDSADSNYRGLAFSFHRAMDHLGAVLGPVVAVGILYAFLGYGLWRGNNATPNSDEMNAMRWLFGIAVIPGLVGVAVILFKLKEVAPRASRVSEMVKEGKLKGWRELPSKFYVFVTVVTIFALGNSSDLFLLLYAKTKFSIGLLHLIGMWVFLHISKIIFSVPGGILSDRIGRRPVICAGWIVYALVYLGMAKLSMQWHFWMLLGAYGFYYGMTEGVEKALVADFVPRELLGTAYGLYHGSIGLAALPASLLFGVFWYEIGPQWAFGIGASLAGLSAVLLIILLSAGRKLRADTSN